MKKEIITIFCLCDNFVKAMGIKDDLQAIITTAQRVIRGLQRLSKPTIAMVNGAAVGFGFGLALACDMRIGSEKARFMVAFTRIGAIPGSGDCWFLPRIVGLSKAAEIIFTGDFLEAAEAYRIGILNKLVEHEDLEQETMALARKIAKGPPIAIRLDKLLLYKGLETDLDSARELAAAYQSIALTSEDFKEGAKAFREKREPTFQDK